MSARNNSTNYKVEFGHRDIDSCFYALVIFVLLLSGCSSYSRWLPSSGPTTEQVMTNSNDKNFLEIRVIDVTNAIAQRLINSQKRNLLSETFASSPVSENTVGSGDFLEISIWEVPPASLFGSGVFDPRGSVAVSRVTTLPEQMINAAGDISIPFVGAVNVAGRSTAEIEKNIVQLLKGMASKPQVLVRVTRNASRNVTVVGEVVQSLRMPLTAKGERLLDALAASGGVRQPIGKVTLQVTRGVLVQALPLETIIKDPYQNIILQAGDVVTALHQPLSFSILGATGKNEELNFEAQGISLAQALGRAGGLQDLRADASGLFIFRFEDPVALGLHNFSGDQSTAGGKIPIVYRVDLKNPATFFVAQDFPIRDKDVMYVSNSSAAELQKFLNMIGSVVGPTLGVRAISSF